MIRTLFDVIVVGGGHGGVEAVGAAIRKKSQTLLITSKKATIGVMSCNPSFGGIGKGHLMKEIDALDGICCRICDEAGIHFKVLNTKKGFSVRGPRAQIDRELYKEGIQRELNSYSNLKIIEGSVEDLTLNENGSVSGVILSTGERILSKTVVLTVGTFLRGTINIGLKSFSSGRLGDSASIGLAQTLESLGFRLSRLKTGTPPRLLKSSINTSGLLAMRGDDVPEPFSYLNSRVTISPESQVPCYLTRTTMESHSVIHESLSQNKHVMEEICGPRYCPSIESKVLKFGQERTHQIWIEPEGLDSNNVYPQGISTTMPEDYQQKFINLIPGCEKAVIAQFGYGVEYDFIDPRECTPSLETKKIPGLFLAGQINGTTGYEEAGAQGLIAGANAGAKAFNEPPLILLRSESYIGVLIDDLTSKGTSEPYRMFTSRAEFRLHLRPENADLRLTKKGILAGIVGQRREREFLYLESKFNDLQSRLKNHKKKISDWNQNLDIKTASSKKNQEVSAHQLLSVANYGIQFCDLTSKFPEIYSLDSLPFGLSAKLKISALYSEYMEQMKHEMEILEKESSVFVPAELDLTNPSLGLSAEEIEKISFVLPSSIASLSLIPGITPHGLLGLLRHVKRLKA